MSYNQGMIDGLNLALQMVNLLEKNPNFRTARACIVAAIADYEDAERERLEEMEREAERYGQLRIIHFPRKENGENE